MRTARTAPLLLAGLALGAGAALVQAQQGLCFHKARHVACHFADGKLVEYETDAAAEFYNIPPYMTFRTRDGTLHAIIGECEITCRP